MNKHHQKLADHTSSRTTEACVDFTVRVNALLCRRMQKEIAVDTGGGYTVYCLLGRKLNQVSFKLLLGKHLSDAVPQDNDEVKFPWRLFFMDCFESLPNFVLVGPGGQG